MMYDFLSRSRLRCLGAGLVLLFCLLARPLSLAAAPVPLRGVVEGFYGRPWSAAERLDIIRFCGEQGFNAYIYAPKDDPYHRAQWREPYPEKKRKELAALVQASRAAGVKFIFALSPGLDARFTPLRGAMDREMLREKLDAMYDIGVRDFAVFFDDIEDLSGRDQAELLAWLDANFVKPHGDIGPLLTVPTEYFRQKMAAANGGPTPYTREFAAGLPKDAIVLYTGEGVVKGGLTAAELDSANRLYGRRLGLWWNYPVNDYMEEKLALGPVEKLPGDVPAAFFNPMSRPLLSQISLATAADWARDPAGYNPDAAWYQAIAAQYGELAPAMERFAAESQRLENNWAAIGPPDGARLRAAIDDLWRAWPAGETADACWQKVHDEVMALEQAAHTLREKLPGNLRRECRPQLVRLKRLTAADQTALALLQSHRAGDAKQTKRLLARLEKQVAKLQKTEKKARIAETSAQAFLTETLAYVRGESPATP